MKISKRLKTICDLVPENKNIIDIGADHALTDIYLTKYKNCSCLATDISKGAIEQAQKNINKYKVDVKTKVTDGLNDIKLKDEILIISGMGTNTIINILNKEITNDIIISSHTNNEILKKFMEEKNYYVYKEVALFEKHNYIITYYKIKK